MSIKAVFRVQCDGPCKGWLSWDDGEALSTTTAAWLFPGERAARNAALQAGWRFSHDRSTPPPYKIYCPNCKENPFGVHLPPDRGQVAALIRAQSGSPPQPYSGCLTHIAGACDGSTRDCVTQKCRATTPSGDFRCTRPQGHDDEHRNGTLDWF